MEVGRPSELTDELTLKIREGVLADKLYKDIQSELEISPNTWDTWVYKDYNGFREKLNSWKRERLVKKAENNIGILLDSEDERVKADITKFTLETLAKDSGYSKRTEMTGKDGKDIPQPIIQLNGVLPNISNQQDNSTQSED